MSNIQQGINSVLATAAIGSKLAGNNEISLEQGAKRAIKGLEDIHQNLKEGKWEQYSLEQKRDVVNRVADLNRQYQDYRVGRHTPGMKTGTQYAKMMKDLEAYKVQLKDAEAKFDKDVEDTRGTREDLSSKLDEMIKNNFFDGNIMNEANNKAGTEASDIEKQKAEFKRRKDIIKNGGYKKYYDTMKKGIDKFMKGGK